MYEFDEDTEIELRGEGDYRGRLSDRWSIRTVPNGGYVMAVAHRALERFLKHPDLLSISGNYLAPTTPGPVELQAEMMRAGKNTSTGMMRLIQAGEERARFVATAGHFDDPKAGTPDLHFNSLPEEIPEPDACVPIPSSQEVQSNIGLRFDRRYAPAAAGWLQGKKRGPLCSGGQIRFADGRPPDLAALSLFCDAYPPTIFNYFGRTGWVPTLQLSVQFRGRPAAGWVRAWFVTHHVTSGLHEEDGELWDADGKLVALSRQLARVRLPKASPTGRDSAG